MADQTAPCQHGTSLRTDLEAILAIPSAGVIVHAVPSRRRLRASTAMALGVVAAGLIASFNIEHRRGSEPVIAKSDRPYSRLVAPARREDPAAARLLARYAVLPAERPVMKQGASLRREFTSVSKSATDAATGMPYRKHNPAAPEVLAERNGSQAMDPLSLTTTLSTVLAERPKANRTESRTKASTSAIDGDPINSVPTLFSAATPAAPTLQNAVFGNSAPERKSGGAETAEVRRRKALDLIRLLRRQ